MKSALLARLTKFLKNRALLMTAIVGTALSFGVNALASNVATLEGLGTTVTAGVMLDSSPVITTILSQPGTFGGHTYTTWAVLAQDSTGSIDVFGAMPSGSYTTPTVGDAINAAGTWSPYHQIPELGTLTSISLASSGNAVPARPTTTIGYLNTSLTIPQNLAGYPVEIDNVSLYTDSAATTPVSGNFAGANTAFYMKDGGGNIMELYFWYTSYACDGAMVGTPIPTGLVDVVGLLSQSGTYGVEITPYSITQVPEPSTLALAALGVAGLLIRRRK
jgi:hypothetical protein